MSYDIVKTVDQKHRKPTVQEMVRLSIAFGTDRLSLVRRATPERGSALVILLFGSRAIREIGPFLRHLIPDQHQDPEKVLILHQNRPAFEGLTWLEENWLTWAYHAFYVADQNCLAFWLVGDRVTDQLAEQLTARGCMTRLS